MAGTLTRHVALLRGVNLGAANRIGMPALRELLTGLGYGDVRTYVASGNVVVSSELGPAELERALRRQIADGLGVDVPVIVRTREELDAVVAACPFAELAAGEPKRLQVTFLAERCPEDVAERAAAAAAGRERVAVDGREVFAWHPEGIGESALAKLLADRRLGVVATARNWRTVLALQELAAA